MPSSDSSPPDAPHMDGVTQPDAGFGTWQWQDGNEGVILSSPGRPHEQTHRAVHDWLGLPSDHVRALLEAWRAAWTAGRPWVRECDVPDERGARRLLLRALPRQTAGDSVPTLDGIWVDVTADAQTQAARRADQRLRLVQEAARVGAFEWSVADQRVDWSPELELLYDLPPGAFGTSLVVWAEHVHPEDVPGVVGMVRAAIARRDETCAFEFRARLPHGGFRWLAGRAHLTYDSNGAFISMVGVNADIDVLKRSEEALRAGETWFRHLTDALPILVWAAMPHGHVQYANEAWRLYTDRVVPSEWLRVVHPDDVDRLRERWEEAVRGRHRFEAHVRLRRAEDGQYRWHSARAVPIAAPDGSVNRWVAAFVDDHELRMLVEVNQHLLASEQRARQAADDAGHQKDEFLATLGHELRTPLNAITGWTSLLRRGELDAEARQRAIEVIDRNADAQRRLIDEVLDMSRLMSGHVRLELQPLSLVEVLAQAVERMRPMAEARGHSVVLQVGDSPATVMGDPARLQQVFTNLLDNAAKFTPPGGHLGVTLVPAADHHTVHVWDDGMGIAPGVLPFVFDRFRQADRPTGGLGLGLATVRQIVQLHGGRVTAHSEGEGRGATFTVTLPIEAAAASPEPPATPQSVDAAPLPLRGLSMLVIEDDPDSREMLSVLLENAGAIPVAAESVREALRLLGDLEIDVVLSDIGMPERDGFDLIRSLRTFPNPRVRRAPAIAVTAFARREDRERILGAGFDAHVSKPVEPVELFSTIVDVVQRRSREPAPDTEG